MKKRLLLLIIIFLQSLAYSQAGFQFYGNNDVKQRVSFKLINNIIIIPLEINGTKLQFILDTGVNKTILFNLSEKDSVGLKNVKQVSLQGLGTGKSINALLSKGNEFRIENMRSLQQDLYVILDDKFDLSSKMGTTIHGIIGYDLLKNVIAKINYNRKTIHFYNPKKFTYKKCKKCEVFPLQFYRRKPYINAQVQLDTIGNKRTHVKLLIDSGGSDAFWLFEEATGDLRTPKKHFNDILGEGLSGTIYGKRSKIPNAFLGKFTIEHPTVSFLDTLSTHNARKFKDRNGSIGGNTLKRFKVWIDYPNNKLVLKKNASLKKEFYYNMSGISLAYDGKELVKEKTGEKPTDSYGNENQNSNVGFISLITTYKYLFKPSFKIDEVVEGSPADLAGIEKGDKLKKVNGKPASDYSLGEIINLFQSKPNKKIKLQVERLGVRINYEFRLKQRI